MSHDNQHENLEVLSRSGVVGQLLHEKRSEDVTHLHCRGILTKSGSRNNRQFYGISSIYGLVHRMKQHLYLTYGWFYEEEDLHPKPITLSLASPQSPMDSIEGVFMAKEQEEDCLRIFWQTYHCAIPILDERSIQEHHTFLWDQRPPYKLFRDDSALIDIILAICIQYGTTHVQRDIDDAGIEDEASVTDPSNAGRWYFQRSQSLLRAVMEYPSVMLLQCQILSVVYLRDASIFNMALSTLAAAVQTAYALGLHTQTPDSGDLHERELLRRLWCMVFALDGKMSIDCGRPCLTHSFGIRLPLDTHELASSSDEMFVPSSKLKITWLTYHVEHVKLIRISKAVYSTIYDHIAQTLGSNTWEQSCKDEDFVKRCDAMLMQELSALKHWSNILPQELRYHLQDLANINEGRSFGVETQQQGPPWLQRHRVMLRLLYHDVFISLCRPFAILPASDQTKPISASSATECLQHSIAITDIAYRVLYESNVLHGWHRAYQFQWDASLFMTAFAFGNLSSPMLSTILTKLEQAISVLEIFGRCFAVARSARKIIRDLHDKLQIAAAAQQKDTVVANRRVPVRQHPA